VRFIISVVLFAVAAVMVAAGILIHSVFLPPNTLTQKLALRDPAPYVLIDATSINKISNRQLISVVGGSSGTTYVTAAPNATPSLVPSQTTSANAVIAWGRKSDVLGFLQGMSYDEVSVAPKTGALSVKRVSGTDVTSPDPFGSDMWIEQAEGTGLVEKDIAMSQSGMLLIATDGTLPAPKAITITWKMNIDESVPRNLVYGGLLVALIGGGIFLVGWWTERRQRRHRQGRMPRPPRAPRWKPRRGANVGPKRGRQGRHALGFVAALALLPVALSGCSLVPSFTPDPIPTTRAAAKNVAVSSDQFAQIIGEIRKSIAAADKSFSSTEAETRLGGAELRFRSAQYAVHKASKDLATPFAIPNGKLRLLLPQRTNGWPRSVFAIIDDAKNAKAPSVAIVMTQQSARENYKLVSAVALEPGAQIPAVAAASQGAAVIYGPNELIAHTPQDAGTRYGDVLLNGAASQYAKNFQNDSLQVQIGADAKKKRAKSLGSTARFSWTESVADDIPISFVTTDAGAIVAMTIQESELVKPAKSGSAITASGTVKAMLGTATSMKGIRADYQYQVLLYVPALGSTEKMRLLGYSYALTGAKKLD
jgi:hypothetical protein